MTPATPDPKTRAAPLEAICDRLDNLEFQVRGLMTSQIVEAKEFVLRDERGEIRARLEMQEYAPRPSGDAGGKVGGVTGYDGYLA